MRNHLAPVQRRDRNGRLVTRHVKTEAGAAATRPELPVPASVAPAPVFQMTPPVQKQLKRELKTPARLYELNADPRLQKLIGPESDHFHTWASEVETYELCRQALKRRLPPAGSRQESIPRYC